MKKRESVLIGIACALFAGIVLYQVIGSPVAYKAKTEDKPAIHYREPEVKPEKKPEPEKEPEPIKEPEVKKEPEPKETDKININEASASELTALDGIGEKKAQDIVSYREENGKFNSLEELTEVKGIGNKTLEKLRSRITV